MDNVSITDATITTVQECEALEAALSQSVDVRCEEDATNTETAASDVAENVTESDVRAEVKDSKEFSTPSYIIDTALPTSEEIKCPDINLGNYQTVIEEDPRVAYTDYDLLATNLQRVCQTPDLGYNLPMPPSTDYSTVLQDQERDDIVPSYAPEYLKLEALKCVAQPALFQGTDETVFHDSLACVDGTEGLVEAVTVPELPTQDYYMEKIEEDVNKEAISELEDSGRTVNMDQQEDGAMALPLESDAVVTDGENATIGIREFENGPIMQFPVSEILDHKVVTEGISFSHQVAEVTDSRVQEMEDYESGMEEEEEDDTILTQTAAAMEEVSLREPDSAPGAAAASAATPADATDGAAAIATTSSVVASSDSVGKKGKGRKSRRDKFFTKLLLGLAYKFDSRSHSSRKNVSRSVEESSCATAGAAAVATPTDKKSKSGTLPRTKMRGKSLVGRLFGSGRSEQPPTTPGSPAIHRLHSTVSRHALPTMPSTTMNKDAVESRPSVAGQQSPIKREEATSRKFRLLTGLKFGSAAGPTSENVKKNNINWFEMLDSGMRPTQQKSGPQIDKPPGAENVANAANT